MMTTVGVRLSAELMAALQAEAEQRDLTPSEVLRLALTQFLTTSALQTQQHKLLYEITKTRAVLLRWIDHQHGKHVGDEILTVASRDAELYLQHR